MFISHPRVETLSDIEIQGRFVPTGKICSTFVSTCKFDRKSVKKLCCILKTRIVFISALENKMTKISILLPDEYFTHHGDKQGLFLNTFNIF